MEQYQYVKRAFSLLLWTHEFSLEQEIDLLNDRKEAHYSSNNSRFIIGYSKQEDYFYIQIWLYSQWKKLRIDNCNSHSTAFEERVQKVEKEAEMLLLDSYQE